ncbi:hypothetical protein [Streptomyces sp. NPDC056549]
MRPADLGRIIPTACCTDHGTDVSPAMEWHPAGGIRCAALTP